MQKSESIIKYQIVPLPTKNLKVTKNTQNYQICEYHKIPNSTNAKIRKYNKILNSTNAKIWKYHKIPNTTIAY